MEGLYGKEIISDTQLKEEGFQIALNCTCLMQRKAVYSLSHTGKQAGRLENLDIENNS